MIPKIIHYCWFGRGEMPELSLRCIESWHRFMPDWEYRLWNEDNFDVDCNDYCREAYEARKFAFVSDYVRLWALERDGGIYFDTDVEAFKSFELLLCYRAFAGFEGSKRLPVGTCVMATQPHGEWITEMLKEYDGRHFVQENRMPDMTTNTVFLSSAMRSRGLIQNGKEQDYKDLHIFTVEYFSPRLTTGEYIRTENTYCDHRGLSSWNDSKGGWKLQIGRLVGQKNMTRLIKLKRRILG